jgi:DNA-binding transcriptional ArsR family regulator/uncharacterized protein YndB with AHSA1/START domain
MEEELTLIWKALADPHRRVILDLLKERPRTTGEICSLFEVSRFAVMKHLTVLEHAGLIVVRREGRERWNYLNAIPLQQIYERWLKPYEVQWAASLLRMKRYVETTGERKNEMTEQTIVHPALTLKHLEMEVPLKSTPERVFKALTHDVAAWWGAGLPYTYSEQGKLVLEPEVGKRFYEDWGNGDGVLFGTVTSVQKNTLLEIKGAFGLGGGVGLSQVRYELVPQEGTTLLKFSLQAMGEIREDFWQGGIQQVWQDLLEVRLRAYLEQNS